MESSSSTHLLVTDQLPRMIVERSKEDHQRIRKLAGSRKQQYDRLSYLKVLVESEQWTAEELSTPHSDGKSVVHIAAWYGAMDTLRYLVEDLGCSVNTIATSPFAYGKTPIFFAITRCRDDVVLFLLQQGANVKIVNNKGQSVLSLASTHLQPDTIAAVQQAELEQADDEWQNYRATDSDGLVYGDLDRRFLERSITEYDVVTEWAVNATSNDTRKGNFARNNPSHANANHHNKRNKQKNKRKGPYQPTKAELDAYEQLWQRLTIEGHQDSLLMDEVGQFLLSVVRFWEPQRCAWLPTAALRFKECVVGKEPSTIGRILEQALSSLRKQRRAATKDPPTSDSAAAEPVADLSVQGREFALVEKLVAMILGVKWVKTQGDMEADRGLKQRRQRQQKNNWLVQYQQKGVDWERAWKAVWHPRGSVRLSKSILQNPERHPTDLSLPRPPELVDTLLALSLLKGALASQVKQQMSLSEPGDGGHRCTLVALDTEWCTIRDKSVDEGVSATTSSEEHASKRGVEVATLQIAWATYEANEGDPILPTYVVDMKPSSIWNQDQNNEESAVYRRAVVELIQWLFGQETVALLWFAMDHDIPKLNAYVGGNIAEASPILSTARCLDLQLMLSACMKADIVNGNSGESASKPNSQYRKAHLPSLKSCCAHYLSSGTDASTYPEAWVLSKKQQCSDWARRPLSTEQLEYAGLDAAVLLVLLSELNASWEYADASDSPLDYGATEIFSSTQDE